MKSLRKYHSPDEHELYIRDTYDLFREAAFGTIKIHYYDFFQIPLGYIFPNLPRTLCRLLIALDSLLVCLPVIQLFASSFAIVAFKPAVK